jgi:hypothetical protein
MPNLYRNLEVEVESPDSNTASMTEYIPVGEALQLVATFKCEKKDVLAFIANVDTAFEVTDPRNEGTFFKFVLTLINGEPMIVIAHRNLENWRVQSFLRIRTLKRERWIIMLITFQYQTKQSRKCNGVDTACAEVRIEI